MKKGDLIGRFSRRFKSIQSNIFLGVSVLVLCAVLVVTMVSMRYTNSAIFENSIVYTQTIIHQLNQNIDSYITYMDNIASVISGSGDAHDYLYREDKYPGRGSRFYESGPRGRLVEQFETILKSRSDIKNIGILRENGAVLFNTGNQSLNPDLDLNSQEWFREARGNYNKYSLTSSHVQHAIRGERSWVITLSRGIRNFSGQGDHDGIVFIDLNYSAISELCDQNSIGSRGYIFILDENGNIVYHPQQQQLYNELQTENIDLVMKSQGDTVRTGTGSDEKIYTMARSDKTGWTIVGCMNTAELLKKSEKAQSIYLLVAVGLIIVALFLSNMIARNITLPLQKLRDSMVRVQEGDFHGADIEMVSENEIGSLTRSFNVMTHRIEELMEQNVHEQEEKRKSEMKALQSQINPHFLYNTLDSIIWMAEGKKNEEVVLMTASLARLLRQSISNEDEVVPLGNEIEYVRSYLTIQKMRYKDKLEFEINVEPSIKYVKIIKLVLQPIVENAIYHGLKYKESRGLLTVHGYLRGENAVIEIIDNGVGMDQETLNHIFERHKVNYHSNGVGVYNVQKRLKLHYGADYGITYESALGEGTTAAIIIPVHQEGSHE